MLHSVYGKIPSAASVTKQKSWIEIQRAKSTGSVVERRSGFFTQFT
jgi:hypothetical protein